MDGVGVSQQMLVKFEMSVTSGPGGFSVCVCMYIRVCACVRGREEGLGGLGRGWVAAGGAGGLSSGGAALRGWRAAAAWCPSPPRSCLRVATLGSQAALQARS